ncbi:MAG: hypothetical protein ACI8QZ_003551 [Chlamydiales bacterium]|jgi:hypothetical protein
MICVALFTGLLGSHALVGGPVAGNLPVADPVVPRFRNAIAVDHDAAPNVWQAGTDGVFAILANDMDLDGDIDVLLNYHRAGIALFENTGPGFSVLEPAIAGATRLGDGTGVVLFAPDDEMLEHIDSAGTAGIYVWRLHRSWHLYARFAEGSTESVTLDLWAPRFGKTKELDAAVFEARSTTEASIHFDPQNPCGVVELGGGHLEILPRDGAQALPIFVGPDMRPVEARPVVLEHPDPHGVAWAQMVGSVHPDLFISQGANVGGVVPPALGKLNRHFAFDPQAERPFARQPEGIVPRDYGRTRRIEWVDIDNDGTYEAYLSNMGSANGLLVRDGKSGALTDCAHASAIDFVRGATSTWMDVDGDSFQDLVLYQGEDALLVVSNDADGTFTAPEEWGQRLMEKEAKDPGLWTRILAQLDFDGDGIMDIWAGRSSGSHFLYRGDGAGFTDARPVPSREATGGRQDVLVLDANNDGWMDVLLLCDRPVLFLNASGERFVPVAAGALFEDLPRKVLSGTVADMNGDGWLDLIFASAKGWHVQLNQGDEEQRFLSVNLTPGPHAPIGALVRVTYSDGRLQVQRFGSNRNSRASQVVRPLHYGRPPSVSFEALEVMWPGSTGWEKHAVPAAGGRLELSPKADR